MKKLKKILIIGVVVGGVELAASGILSGVARVASFEDSAFLLGLATLVVGLLSLFGVSRLRTGAAVSGYNANAQTAFAAQVAFEEQRMLSKMPSSARTRMSRVSSISLGILLGAVIAWAGFGISLLF